MMNRSLNGSKVFVTLMLSTAASTATFAEEATVGKKLYEVIEGQADLTPAQSSDLNKIKKLSTTADVKIISVDVNTLLSANSVTADLNNNKSAELKLNELWSSSITANISEFSRTGSTMRTMSTTSPLETEGSDSQGSIKGEKNFFFVKGKKVYGTIISSDGLYRISPLGDGAAHALIKIDQTKFPAEHPPVQRQNLEDIAPEFGILNDTHLRKQNDTKIYGIDVLVAYTAQAKDAAVGIQDLAEAAIEQTNASYSNSGIRAKLVSAGVREVAYTETGNFNTDLAAIRNLRELRDARSASRADLVIVLVDGSQYCGLASQIYSSKPNAYAIVYHGCAVDNLSFAHEIGHLQGARHNPEADSGSMPFAYGHGYMDGTKHIRDIMSYDCPEGCIRQPLWSSPPDFGSEDRCNAARVIDETAPYVASMN